MLKNFFKKYLHYMYGITILMYTYYRRLQIKKIISILHDLINTFEIRKRHTASIFVLLYNFNLIDHFSFEFQKKTFFQLNNVIKMFEINPNEKESIT